MSSPGLWERFAGAWNVLRAGPGSGAASWFSLGMDLLAKGGTLREPYRNSVWVSRAIKKIAGPLAAMPIEVYRADAMAAVRAKAEISKAESRNPRRLLTVARAKGLISARDQEQAVFSAPGLAGWLRQPMARMSWSDFVEAAVGWLKLSGEVFWLQNEAALPFQEAANGWPKTIVARPDRMREILHGEELIGWEYRDQAQKRWMIPDERLIQTKCWNPYNLYRGLAEWEAARIASESDYLAGKFKRDLMSNNGDTGPIVGLKNGNLLSDDQLKQVREQLREKRRLQQQGVFAPIFLPGEITVEDPKVRTVDGNYVAMRLEDHHEVAIAFGVPPSMFDVKSAYSIGSASDYYQLIVDTCIPTGEKIADSLERLFKLISGEDLEVHFNSDEHPVMRTVRRERIDSVDKLWTKGMPMSLVSEYLDLNLPPWAGWETSYLPFSAAPAGSTPPDQLPGLTDVAPADNSPAALAMQALIQRRDAERRREAQSQTVSGRVGEWESGIVPACDCCGCSLEDADVVVRGRDSREVAQWKHIVAPRIAFIKRYRSKFDKVLMEARAEVLSKLERHGAKVLSPESKVLSPESGVQSRAAAGDFMFDLDKFKQALIGEMRGVSGAAIEAGGTQLLKELGLDDPFKAPAKATLDFLSDRENKLAGVADDVFGRMKARIQEGLEGGDTMKEISAAIRAESNDISDGRGKVVAQTETAACFGFSRHESMVQSGIRFKRWLTSGNANVRWAHVKMNGTVMPIDRNFVVVNKDGAKDEILHPADGEGQPWNVINCHCVELTSRTGPEDPQAEPAE